MTEETTETTARRRSEPEFIEAIARGLSVLRCFGPQSRTLTLRDVAVATDLPRPTARRVLLTLHDLGYVRRTEAGFELTPQVLELGMAYIGGLDLWDLAEPHLRTLVAQTNESSSISQLDGSDIVYVARLAVPKIITLRVSIGTRFPAMVTSQGKVMLAAQDAARVRETLRTPSRSEVVMTRPLELDAALAELDEVRERGWAVADEELAPGIRSVAVPLRGADGQVGAAINVTVNAAETSLETLLSQHLPPLLEAAAKISADWSLVQGLPIARA